MVNDRSGVEDSLISNFEATKATSQTHSSFNFTMDIPVYAETKPLLISAGSLRSPSSRGN
jgi:hypothetical protein